MKLFARFNVDTIAPLLIAAPCAEEDLIEWEYIKNKFTIKISLPIIKPAKTWRQDGKGIHEVLKMELLVSREEITFPNAGNREERASFFNLIHDDYIETANQSINALLSFFRYKHGNPLIKEVYFYDDNQLCNPEWLDEDGNTINPEFGISTGSCMPARYYDLEFDIQSYEHEKNKEQLEKWLKSHKNVDLYEEILSDARDAIVLENYRRAILEIAIACEIFVKQIFFRGTELSSAVFDYLESKRKVEISILDLISKVSKEAFGESFKDECKDDYKNIDYLFRARNKIAHQGEVFYKDDSGKRFEIHDDNLMQWWRSVKKMISWLDKKTKAS